jgi:hypothetical protein
MRAEPFGLRDKKLGFSRKICQLRLTRVCGKFVRYSNKDYQFHTRVAVGLHFESDCGAAKFKWQPDARFAESHCQLASPRRAKRARSEHESSQMCGRHKACKTYQVRLACACSNLFLSHKEKTSPRHN